MLLPPAVILLCILIFVFLNIFIVHIYIHFDSDYNCWNYIKTNPIGVKTTAM